ncbi:sensor histidine kinase [Rhodoluna lacicola]|uniref:Signal transduction histidine kinase n=1 Tax=Rhodoluna lacicola TaxID=529884 RepID=A0A060JDX0_9MICO|nr:ATP-binding protein [Rhodoluna lacicola]AIC48056.1 Signal transduction histidine kinase [Rhodoluna lacicola]
MKLKNSVVWQRIAGAHLFTWGYLGYHVFAMVSMRFFLNSENIIEFLPFWTAMVVLEHLVIFTIFGLAKKFIKKYSAPLVIAGVLLIGVIRTLITTSLAIAVGADPGVAWQYQLLLGALWELSITVMWANLNGAFRDHSQLVRKLRATQDSIMGYRENAEIILAEEQEKLLKLTRNTLLPQIQTIEETINAGNLEMSTRWGIAHELKGIIYNQVRPLSESLRSTARALTAPAKRTPSHFLYVITIPKSFRIVNSIFPTATYAAMSLSFLASPFWLLDMSWVLPSLLLSLSYLAIILAFNRFFKNTPEQSAWIGVPVLVIMAVLAVIPTYLVAVLFYPDTQQAAIYGSTLVYTSLMVVGILALLDSFDFEARRYRDLLQEHNEELALEVTLFEQQLWVARRNWSLVIHGTVQASLTAALTRLNAPDADKKTLDLAKKDLDRAIMALSTPPNTEIKFASAIKEIIATWQGVCDVDLDVQPEVKKLVSKDPRLSMCVNEIVKEAVSNAVRHGDARTAQVSIKLAADGLIDLTVKNDGQAPRIGVRHGLGGALLDELTVDWSLDFDSATDQTILSARLPFSTAQA